MYQGSLGEVSNRADWTQSIEVIDDTTNAAVNLTDAEITLEVRQRRPSDSTILTATVGDGITLSDAEGGIFTWLFDRDDMQDIESGTYDVGCVITIEDETTQLFVGTVSIIDGVVRP